MFLGIDFKNFLHQQPDALESPSVSLYLYLKRLCVEENEPLFLRNGNVYSNRLKPKDKCINYSRATSLENVECNFLFFLVKDSVHFLRQYPEPLDSILIYIFKTLMLDKKQTYICFIGMDLLFRSIKIKL